MVDRRDLDFEQVQKAPAEVRWDGVLDVDGEGQLGGEKENVVYTQQIEYTDFPLAAITLYNDGGILCLPGER